MLPHIWKIEDSFTRHVVQACWHACTGSHSSAHTNSWKPYTSAS